MPVVIIILLMAAIITLLVFTIKIVPQEHAYVIERLGKYCSTKKAGLNFILPYVDKVVRKVSLKEQIGDYPPQPVITKDNVTIHIDTVVFYKVVDPKLFTYGVEDPFFALESLTATTLRNLIGELELDETLTSRDTINKKLSAVLDDATDKWGVKVNRVELQDITPPDSVLTAMRLIPLIYPIFHR